MWLACQKKSHLICDEITNYPILTQPIPKFFLKYKTETAKQGRDSCLKKINVSEIHNFVTYQITFLLTCQPHKSLTKS